MIRILISLFVCAGVSAIALVLTDALGIASGLGRLVCHAGVLYGCFELIGSLGRKSS